MKSAVGPLLAAVLCIAMLLSSLPARASSGLLPKADLVVVKKSERKLILMHDGHPFRVFTVALGPRPWGAKVQRGDERTPEGHYRLDFKRPQSNFYKAIHISYPNDRDRERARELGVDPGGNIMIHGFPNNNHEPPALAQQFNWTDGCIAVTDAEMDVIWASVEPGTPIEIAP